MLKQTQRIFAVMLVVLPSITFGAASLSYDRDGCLGGNPNFQLWKITTVFSFGSERDNYWLGFKDIPTEPMVPWGGNGNSQDTSKSQWPVGTGGADDQFWFAGRGCNSTTFAISGCTLMVNTGQWKVPLSICTPGDD